MSTRRSRIGALLTVAAVGLGGCASAGTPRSAPDTATGSFQPMAVTAVQVLNATRVRITAQVPAPQATCVRHLGGRVTGSDARSVFVQLTFTSPAPAPGGCAQTGLASVVVAGPALRGRQLGVDSEAPRAPVTGSSAYRHCTGAFGCAAPPRNHCDPAWTRLAGHSGELQPERSYRILGCDQTWLVMDIDATVTGCQPLDGATRPPGCRGPRVRWFFQFEPPQGWVVVASGNRAGCADVHARVRAFPAALCCGLAPR